MNKKLISLWANDPEFKRRVDEEVARLRRGYPSRHGGRQPDSTVIAAWRYDAGLKAAKCLQSRKEADYYAKLKSEAQKSTEASAETAAAAAAKAPVKVLWDDEAEEVVGLDERTRARLAAADIELDEFTSDKLRNIGFPSSPVWALARSKAEGLALLSLMASVSQAVDDNDEIADFLLRVLAGETAPLGVEYIGFRDDCYVVTPDGLSFPLTVAGVKFDADDTTVSWTAVA